MSENPLNITTLNDYIFCPASIYFHQVDAETERFTYQSSYQLNGTAKHEAVDENRYSSKKDILQGIHVYSEKYNLIGKIDVFDVSKGVLTERKKKVNQLFEGYIFQVYAQYFALKEQGYIVNEIRIYSMDDNVVYPILLPSEDPEMLDKFESTIKAINRFSFDGFKQDNLSKCERCIYEPLCSFSNFK